MHEEPTAPSPSPSPARPPGRRTSRRGFLLLAGGAGAGLVAAGAAGAGVATYIGGRRTGGLLRYAEPPSRLNPPALFTLGKGDTRLPGKDPQVRAAHLLRRAGFGFRPAELDRFAAMDYAEAVETLINYERVSDDALEQRLEQAGLDLTRAQDLQTWWLTRMVYSARPLQERMVFFWHNLLTSGLSKLGNQRAYMMKDQNEFFRAHALGAFDTILKGIAKDPAMMVWLDTDTSVRGRPNENYARELLELFSMGIGHYTEDDVKEAARAFTGWTLRREGLRFEPVFNPRQFDNGPKTFLGHKGNFTGDDIVDIIVQQPATATYISKRLFAFFAYDDPEPDVIEPLAETFARSGYSIKEVVRQILLSDAFLSEKAYRAQIKSPTDYVVGLLKGLDLDLDLRAVPGALTAMGQQLMNPPNVAGWPGGEAWISAATFFQRLNFLDQVIAGKQGRPPAYLMSDAVYRSLNFTTAGAFVDHFVRRFLDGNLSEEGRRTILAFLTGGPPDESAPLSLSAPNDEARARGAIYLTVATPEFMVG